MSAIITCNTWDSNNNTRQKIENCGKQSESNSNQNVTSATPWGKQCE